MKNSTIRLRGELEIDAKRGVVYFHLDSVADVIKYKMPTVLRVSGLHVPVRLKNGILDIKASYSDDQAREKLEKKLEELQKSPPGVLRAFSLPSD